MNKEDKQETRIIGHLDKIKSSHHFANSPQYRDLLTFVVDKALKGEHLKEYIIGVEFFKNRYKSGAADSVVRVNMHNLRKKLAAYYEDDGLNDNIRFEFEKRSYNLHINSAPQRLANSVNRRIVGAFCGVALAIIVVLIISIKPFKKEYFWHDFLDKNQQTICILADHLILNSKINGRNISLFHQDVITRRDFEQQKGILDSMAIADYSFFTKSIPYAMQKLGRLYGRYDHDFTPITESNYHFANSKNANIIYIGQPKLMDNSKYIFLHNSKKFKYDDYCYYGTGDNGELKKYNSKFAKNGRQIEYGIISYMPMRNGYKALFFTSNNDIGIMAAIDKFTTPKFIEGIYSNFKYEDSYFNILYKVEGVERTDLDFEIVQIEEIHD